MTAFLTDLNKILKEISNGKDNYLKNRSWVHQRACEAVYHAAQHGDPRALTPLFDLVSKNDKASFKSWALRMSSFTTDDGKARSWLKFTDEKGFQVMAGPSYPEAVRKDAFTPEDIMASTPFYDISRPARQALEATEKRIAAIDATVDNLKTINTRMGRYDIRVPKEIDDALKLVREYFAKLAAQEASTPSTPVQTEETVAEAPAVKQAA